MTEKKAQLLRAEKEVRIDQTTAPEFFLLYQKAVLLALKEQGAINDLQLGLCLDRLTAQCSKSAHSPKGCVGDMLPAKGAGTC